LDLTEDLELGLKVNLGAGDMQLGISELNLSFLDTNQGVGRMVIRLPERSSGDIHIKQAVGLIQVTIPEEIRISVDAQNGLSKVDFPRDFELDDGFFSSPGATPNNADLVIVVEQAIGLISFEYAR
jgi:hypothetical protein